MFPKIKKTAVPLPKHSAILGHLASSQIVWSFADRRRVFILE
jgi:hypothetical protein